MIHYVPQSTWLATGASWARLLLVVVSIETAKPLPSPKVSGVTRYYGLCLPEGEVGTVIPCVPQSTWLATEASWASRQGRLCLPKGEVGTMFP